MSDNDNGEAGRNEPSERRRDLLKMSAMGVLPSSALGRLGGVPREASTAQAGTDIADGPFFRSYEGEPVSPDTVEFVTTDEDAVTDPGGGEGEGEEGLREVPKKAPEGDGKTGGDGGPAQRSAAERDLVSDDFDGLGSADVRGVVPSDNQVAVGSDHVVQAVNSRWAIYDKDGTQQFEVTLDDWWQNVSPFIYESDGPERAQFFEDYIIFDPRARYDAESGHYILECVDYSLNTGRGAFLLSVSATDDPTGTWYNYRIPPIPIQNGEPGLVDYPQLGFDGEAIYLTQNFFSPGFTQATMVALDKEEAYAGETADATHFTDLRNPDGSLAFTVQPAPVNESGVPGYFVNSRFFQGQSLTTWTLEDPISDPTLTNDAVRVQPYHNAPAAKQPDTEETIDTLDTRIMRVAYDGDDIWAAHTVNDGRSRWYEIDPSGSGESSLVQSGEFKRNGRPTFLPAIEADGDQMVFAYNTSTPRDDGNGFVNAEVAARDGTTPEGEIGAYDVLQFGVDDYDYANGEAGEDDNSPQVMRWGDYNGITVDPEDGSYWITAQYTPTPDEDSPDEYLVDDDYDTRIGNVSLE